MGRWRPPSAERASPYITERGYAALKAEYEQLWRVRRPEVVRALAAAAAEGDRSENAEYQYRKKELREIDRRVRYLQKRLPQLKVANQVPVDAERVYFGARVRYVDDRGREREIRIVGADETALEPGGVSVDAPLARALLGRRTGDVIELQLPDAAVEVEVLAVSYPEYFTKTAR